MSDHGDEAVPTPPPTANTGAVGALGRGATPTPAPRKAVVSWAFWDWATQPFNSVILTFVWASLYLVSWHFLPTEVAKTGEIVGPDGVIDHIACNTAANEATEYCRQLADLSAGYGWATTAAGILILLLAPVLGQRADRAGRKKRWLFIFTMVLALLQFALFFTFEDPAYFWFGAIVLALGAVVSEIAGVNYNAMLVEVSTPKTIGRVSGLGWGLGYIGGIVALGIVVALSQFDLLPAEDGLGYRLIAVGAAVWCVVFSIPIWLNVPEGVPSGDLTERVGFFKSYVVLVKDLGKLFREHRSAFWFLLASAVYRDGLAGVFAFGGVLAAAGFGFGDTQVMIFGIAANIVAGISTIIAGRFDDRFGGKAVVVTALVGLVAMALVVFALKDLGSIVFWVCGLVLCAFVGPAQAASRSLLARVTPRHMQGEIFGLYATTGRVASFIAPLMWATFTAAFGGIVYGVLGLAIVLFVGLVLLLLVRLPKHVRID